MIVGVDDDFKIQILSNFWACLTVAEKKLKENNRMLFDNVQLKRSALTMPFLRMLFDKIVTDRATILLKI